MSRLSVLVVTFQSEKHIGHCLASLPSDPDVEILIYDNASTDSTLDCIRRTRPDAEVVACKENIGFARAMNRLAARASGDVFLLLNPDAVINADEVSRLVERLNIDSSVGVVSPRLLHPKERLSVESCGRSPSIWRMMVHYLGINRLPGIGARLEGFHLLPTQTACAKDVDWVSGACMAVRADVWRQVNGLTEKWFMYAEDIDFCRRVKRDRYRIVYDPAIYGVHVIGGSTNNGTATKPNASWIVNLHQHAVDAFEYGPAGSFAWRFVVTTGLLARSAVYEWRARRESPIDWHSEARRFRLFARALW